MVNIRGVHQECPLSPLLFTTIIEMLALTVRGNGEIHGVLMDDTEHKMILYADDITFFLQQPVVCFDYLARILGGTISVRSVGC